MIRNENLIRIISSRVFAGAKNIKLKPEVDNSLIGGFIVQFGKDGSGYIDLSIKGAVDKITGQLQPTA